jgi:hypothetical protein
MIDRGHASPVSKQCVALRISRGSIYYEAGYMLGDLAALDGGSALRRRLRRYALPRLLVIDEVGYLFCSSRHAGLLELVSRRYEHASTLVASLVDRLIHHAEILSLKGKSYGSRKPKHAPPSAGEADHDRSNLDPDPAEHSLRRSRLLGAPLANHRASRPVGHSLYLPKSGSTMENVSQGRCARQCVFKTKPEIALEQLRWARKVAYPRGVVLMNAGYGTSTDRHTSITVLELEYVAAVSRTLPCWARGHKTSGRTQKVKPRPTDAITAPKCPPLELALPQSNRCRGSVAAA